MAEQSGTRAHCCGATRRGTLASPSHCRHPTTCCCATRRGPGRLTRGARAMRSTARAWPRHRLGGRDFCCFYCTTIQSYQSACLCLELETAQKKAPALLEVMHDIVLTVLLPKKPTWSDEGSRWLVALDMLVSQNVLHGCSRKTTRSLARIWVDFAGYTSMQVKVISNLG